MVRPCVAPDMALVLDKAFSEDEVTAAAFSMASNKAPGPDGFHAVFFQNSWQTISRVATFVRNMLLKYDVINIF